MGGHVAEQAVRGRSAAAGKNSAISISEAARQQQPTPRDHQPPLLSLLLSVLKMDGTISMGWQQMATLPTQMRNRIVDLSTTRQNRWGSDPPNGH